jgi:hypothetical protein
MECPPELRRHTIRALGALEFLQTEQCPHDLLQKWQEELTRSESPIQIDKYYNGFTQDTITWHLYGLESEEVCAFTTGLNFKLQGKPAVWLEQIRCRYEYEIKFLE